jgi:hypothetical protein
MPTPKGCPAPNIHWVADGTKCSGLIDILENIDKM